MSVFKALFHLFFSNDRYAAAAAAKSRQSVRLCSTPQTAAHQAPLSLGFPRQEHWSGLPFPSPTDMLTSIKRFKKKTNKKKQEEEKTPENWLTNAALIPQ